MTTDYAADDYESGIAQTDCARCSVLRGVRSSNCYGTRLRATAIRSFRLNSHRIELYFD